MNVSSKPFRCERRTSRLSHFGQTRTTRMRECVAIRFSNQGMLACFLRRVKFAEVGKSHLRKKKIARNKSVQAGTEVAARGIPRTDYKRFAE